MFRRLKKLDISVKFSNRMFFNTLRAWNLIWPRQECGNESFWHNKKIGRRKNCWKSTNLEIWILSNKTHHIPSFGFPVAMTATFFTINMSYSFKHFTIFKRRVCVWFFCCCYRLPYLIEKIEMVFFFLEKPLVSAFPEGFNLKKQFVSCV